MALEDSLPPHALTRSMITAIRETDQFRDVHANWTVFKPEAEFDLVVGFQLMREDDSVGLGFSIEDETWEVVESASYDEAGGVDAAGKIVADALEEWSVADEDDIPEIYSEFSNGDRRGDVQAYEDVEFSDAVYAQYRAAVE